MHVNMYTLKVKLSGGSTKHMHMNVIITFEGIATSLAGKQLNQHQLPTTLELSRT